MLFRCPHCNSRVSTPTQFDEEIREIQCGRCGEVLNAREHGRVVSPVQTSPTLWQKIRAFFSRKSDDVRRN